VREFLGRTKVKRGQGKEKEEMQQEEQEKSPFGSCCHDIQKEARRLTNKSEES